ncbi:hypothetical protein C8R46DRAFT_1198373 [Mycena filopes]|nr:hypothetical protein C8R46DRAFT_1198373 [Mycena filopes]
MRSRDVDTYSHRCSRRWSDPRNMKRDGLQPHPARARGVAGGGQFTRGGGNEWMSVRKRADPESTVQPRRKGTTPGVPLCVAFAPSCPNLPRADQEKKIETLPNLDSTPLASQKGRRFAISFTQVSAVREKIGKKIITYGAIGRHVEDAIETRRRVSSITSQCSGSRGTRGEAQQPEVRKCTFRVCAGFEEFWDRATSDIDCIHTPDVHRPTACGRESLGLVRARNLQNHFLHLPPQRMIHATPQGISTRRIPSKLQSTHLFPHFLLLPPSTSPSTSRTPGIDELLHSPSSPTAPRRPFVLDADFHCGRHDLTQFGASSHAVRLLSTTTIVDVDQQFTPRMPRFGFPLQHSLTRPLLVPSEDFKSLGRFWRRNWKFSGSSFDVLFAIFGPPASLPLPRPTNSMQLSTQPPTSSTFAANFPLKILNWTQALKLKPFNLSARIQIDLIQVLAARCVSWRSKDKMNRDFKYLCNELSLRGHFRCRPSRIQVRMNRDAPFVSQFPSRLVNLTLLVLNDLLELFKVDSAGAQIGLFKISRVIIALSDARRTDLSAQPYELSSKPSGSTPSVDGGHARLNSGIQLQVWPRRRSRSSKILKRPSFDASRLASSNLLFSPAGPMVERLAAWVWNRFEGLDWAYSERIGSNKVQFKLNPRAQLEPRVVTAHVSVQSSTDLLSLFHRCFNPGISNLWSFEFSSHLGCGHTHHGLGLEGPKQWTFDLSRTTLFNSNSLAWTRTFASIDWTDITLVLAGSRSSKFKFNTTSDSTPLTLVDASSLTVTVYSFNCVSELSSRYGRVWDRSADCNARRRFNSFNLIDSTQFESARAKPASTRWHFSNRRASAPGDFSNTVVFQIYVQRSLRRWSGYGRGKGGRVCEATGAVRIARRRAGDEGGRAQCAVHLSWLTVEATLKLAISQDVHLAPHAAEGVNL